MISSPEARSRILERLITLPLHSSTIEEAYGCVLRQDVYAQEDIPAFDRSAMDGYALIADDIAPQLRIVGEIQPGAAPDFKIKRGECARIFTGAPLPEGATQVLMQEDARVENGLVTRLQVSRLAHFAIAARMRGEAICCFPRVVVWARGNSRCWQAWALQADCFALDPNRAFRYRQRNCRTFAISSVRADSRLEQCTRCGICASTSQQDCVPGAGCGRHRSVVEPGAKL